MQACPVETGRGPSSASSGAAGTKLLIRRDWLPIEWLQVGIGSLDARFAGNEATTDVPDRHGAGGSERADLALDLDGVLAALPAELRDLAVRLREQTVSQAARAMNVPRTTLLRQVERPPRLLVYGTSDIGKSTFGSQAPSPVFVPIVTLAHHFGWAAAFGSIVPPSQTILHFGNAAASLAMPACVSLTPSLPWLWLTWRYRSVFSLASDSSPASVS
jgi:hypothetical protein